MSVSICDSHIGTPQWAHFGWKMRFRLMVTSDFRIEVKSRRPFGNKCQGSFDAILGDPLKVIGNAFVAIQPRRLSPEVCRLRHRHRYRCSPEVCRLRHRHRYRCSLEVCRRPLQRRYGCNPEVCRRRLRWREVCWQSMRASLLFSSASLLIYELTFWPKLLPRCCLHPSRMRELRRRTELQLALQTGWLLWTFGA
jgi:hypothetical protein